MVSATLVSLSPCGCDGDGDCDRVTAHMRLTALCYRPVTVTVSLPTDVNNNRPVFPSCDQYRPEVQENKGAGTAVLRVSRRLIKPIAKKKHEVLPTDRSVKIVPRAARTGSCAAATHFLPRVVRCVCVCACVARTDGCV